MRFRLAALSAMALLLPLWAQAPQGGLRVPPMQYQVQQLSPELSIVVSPDPPGSAAAPVVAVLVRLARRTALGHQSVAEIPAGQLTSELAAAAAQVRGASRAVVVVAGAIEPNTVLAQAAHIFSVDLGAPQRGSAAPPASPDPPAQAPEPGPLAPLMMTIAWPGPAAGAKDTAALAMLGEDLFAGPAARERHSLVVKWRAALAVRGGLNGPAGWDTYRGPGQFLARVWFRPAVRPTLVRELVFRQIHEIEVNGVSPEELRRTEIWSAADWLRRGQTAAARARRLARAYWETGSPAAANNALRPMLDASAQEMQAAAARYLSDAAARIATGPAPAALSPAGVEAVPGRNAAESPLLKPGATWIPVWRPPAPAFDAQFQNGLRLIVIHDANLPLVTVRLSVRAAPLSQGRWSRALARVILAGSTRETGLVIAERVRGIGGTLWARAGRRRFTLGASCLSPYAGVLLRRLAALAIRPAVPAPAVARVLLNTPAWRAWRRSDPSWLARGLAARLLRSAPAPTRTLNQETLLAFAHHLLLPNNDARMVIVGDVDPAWAESMVEQYFVDAWPFGNPPPSPARKQIAASRLFLVQAPGPRAAFAFAARPPAADSPGFAAWLLVRQAALRVGATSGAVPTSQLPDALRLALVRRAELAAAPPSAAWLQDLKARLIREWMNGWQSQGQIAGAWNQFPGAYQPSTAWAAAASVTPAAFQAAARRYLSPAVIVAAGDVKALQAPLARLRQAPVTILDSGGHPIGSYPPEGAARSRRLQRRR